MDGTNALWVSALRYCYGIAAWPTYSRGLCRRAVPFRGGMAHIFPWVMSPRRSFSRRHGPHIPVGYVAAPFLFAATALDRAAAIFFVCLALFFLTRRTGDRRRSGTASSWRRSWSPPRRSRPSARPSSAAGCPGHRRIPPSHRPGRPAR